MNTRILTHKINSQAKISESMSNDGMKKGGDMTILYVPKKMRRIITPSKEKRRMKQIMVKIKKDENEMIVKYNRTR